MQGSWIASPPTADIALTPRRLVEPGVLRAVLAAIRERGSLEAFYQSMSRAEPVWRRMSPHALGYDGFRWHARAYCHIEGEFKDFLLPRILDVGSPGPQGAPAADDRLWNEAFDLEIGAHPDLGATQRAVIEKDFGMVDGKLVLTIRYAMLFYVLRRLNLLDDATRRSPRTQHIVALDHGAVEEALKVAKFQL